MRGPTRRLRSLRSLPMVPVAAGVGFLGLVAAIAAVAVLVTGVGDDDAASFEGAWPPAGEVAFVGVEYPPGKTAPLVGYTSGAGDIYALSPADGTTARLTDDPEGWRFWPTWSPDGRWLAFFQHELEHGEGFRDDTGSLRVVGRASGTKLTLAGPFPLMPDFTTNDGEALPVPFPLVPRPSWYRDSETIAFVSQGFITATASIDEGYIGDQRLMAYYPSWSASGERGVVSGGSSLISFGTVDGEFRGLGVRDFVTDTVTVPNGNDDSRQAAGDDIEVYPVFSPDERWIAWWGFQPGECCAEVYLLDTEQPVTPVPHPTYVEYGYSIAPEVREVGEGVLPRWSADSQRIAFVRDRSMAGCGQVVVYDVAEGSSRTITGEGECAHSPAWSPDADWLAFVSNRDDEHGEIYVARPDGTEARRLTYNGLTETMLDWGRER